MTDIEDILATRTPRTASQPILFKRHLASERDRLFEMLTNARKLERSQPQSLGASHAESLQVEYQAIVEQCVDAAEVFTAQAVDADWLDDLKRRHPPSDEQLERYREEVKQNPLFARVPVINTKTAGPELLAKAVIDPAMNVEQARNLWSTHEGERHTLWNLAWNVQQEGSELPFSSAATAPTTGGGEESNTLASGDSPSQS